LVDKSLMETAANSPLTSEKPLKINSKTLYTNFSLNILRTVQVQFPQVLP